MHAQIGLECSKMFRLPGYSQNRHMKVARLSALRTGGLYPPKEDPWYSFLLQTQSTPGPQRKGKSKLIKNLKDPTRNLARYPRPSGSQRSASTNCSTPKISPKSRQTQPFINKTATATCFGEYQASFTLDGYTNYLQLFTDWRWFYFSRNM